ncbi:hypothetical protein PV08_06712 [Exophiala spinifera]|uniref:Uncharacterized protein n=1 Tax=Exophiala spinifera TaxID=91928 RepID=A0A0D1YFX5_9EURO|nr:uncharacterized protein PV08_06712 [Exophiala spinifera]KIW13931.1 hypothetical protein PV08_06712 [Exophiala spinifera]
MDDGRPEEPPPTCSPRRRAPVFRGPRANDVVVSSPVVIFEDPGTSEVKHVEEVVSDVPPAPAPAPAPADADAVAAAAAAAAATTPRPPPPPPPKAPKKEPNAVKTAARTPLPPKRNVQVGAPAPKKRKMEVKETKVEEPPSLKTAPGDNVLSSEGRSWKEYREAMKAKYPIHKKC